MDVTAVAQHANKLEKLLNSILKPNFRIRSDTNFNVLITHLSGKENPALADALLALELFHVWIERACTYWERNGDVWPGAAVAAFVFDLIGIVARDETRFLQLSTKNIYARLGDLFHVQKNECAPAIKVAYVRMLQTFVMHKAGIGWVKATNAWLHVWEYCISVNSTYHLLKECYEFMYRLLECRVFFDEGFCAVVVDRMVEPLLTQISRHQVRPDRMQRNVAPYVRMISAILAKYFKNEWGTQRFKHIPALFSAKKLQPTVLNYLLLPVEEQFWFELAVVEHYTHFIAMCDECAEYKIGPPEALLRLQKACTLIDIAITMKHAKNASDLTVLLIREWAAVQTRLTPAPPDKKPNEDPFAFQTEIALLQLVPLYHYAKVNFKVQWELKMGGDAHHSAICLERLFGGRITEQAMRIGQRYRDFLDSAVFTPTVPLNALQNIQRSLKYYQRDSAIVVFEGLLYLFNACIPCVHRSSEAEKTDLVTEYRRLYSLLLVVLQDLIVRFELTRNDCPVSNSLLDFTLDFLEAAPWPTLVMTAGFKLLHTVVERKLSGQFAKELVGEKHLQRLERVWPFLKVQFEHGEWEIRDSALEVFASVAKLAESQFPSFRTEFINHELLRLVLDMADRDNEAFVRATAVRCLQHIVEMSEHWPEPIRTRLDMDKFLDKLKHDDDGFVRVQTMMVVRMLYAKERYAPTALSEIYSRVMHIAEQDSNWEAKKQALLFCQHLIKEKLIEYGFHGRIPPPPTTNNPPTLVDRRQRLYCLLLDLSRTGVLELLMAQLRDEFDTILLELAVGVVQPLCWVLHSYSDLLKVPRDELTWASQGFDGNVVVERAKVFKFLDFLQHEEQGFERKARDTRNWLDGLDNLDSLLNDMLIKNKEVIDGDDDDGMNDLDCY